MPRGGQALSSIEYEALRSRRPELRLPAWRQLRNTDRHKAKRLWPDEMVAMRLAKLLQRDPEKLDRIRLNRRQFRRPFRAYAVAQLWKAVF